MIICLERIGGTVIVSSADRHRYTRKHQNMRQSNPTISRHYAIMHCSTIPPHSGHRLTRFPAINFASLFALLRFAHLAQIPR
jgi:hypothetical protein